MAFCDQRGIELKAALAPNLTIGMPDSDRKVLLAAVTEWDTRRREHLEALAKCLLEPGGIEAAKTWLLRVAGLRDALRKFSETLRSTSKPLEGSLQFLQSNCSADEKFINAIALALVAAEARDYMVGYLDVLRTETKSLETKWAALQSQHASYEAMETAVVQQVAAIVRSAAASARDLDSKMASLTASSISQVKNGLQAVPEGTADRIEFPMNNELVIAGLIVDNFRILKVGIEEQTSRFERYMREESGSVLFVFQDVREDTQTFIDKFGYKMVLEKEQAAVKALDAIVAIGGTSSGNKADAEKFVENTRLAIKDHVNNAQKIWDDFVIKHEKKFFGPVGPDIGKALLNRDHFRNEYRNLQADNLNELAARWRNNAREVWGVSFDGIPPKVAEKYRNALKDNLRALDELLKDPLLKRFWDGASVVMDNAWTLITK